MSETSQKANLKKIKIALSALTATSFAATTGIAPASANTVCTVTNLAQLQAAGINADCDIVDVRSNISFDPLEEDSQSVVVNHTTLIRGNVTIDGNRTGQMFIIEGDGIDVTFQSLNLIDGGLDPEEWIDGGYDFAEGGGTISTTADGLFEAENVDIVLDGVTIQNSSASFGGAINLGINARLSFTGDTSYFLNNTAYVGGAVAALYFTSLEAIENVVFDGNEAIVGGAIGGFFFNEVVANEARFTNNFALRGGAISGIFFNFIDIRNSYFANNRAVDSVEDLPNLGEYFDEGDGPDDGGYGGAIAQQYGSLWIENSTFFNNQADSRGGAIQKSGGGQTQIVLSTFLNNSANNIVPDATGQSIFTTDTIRLFGNIFASDQTNFPQLISGGEGAYTDLGANLSTSSSDSNFFLSPLSSVTTFGDLRMSNIPTVDTSFLGSTPVLTIETSSSAADAVDLDQLSDSLLQLSFPGDRSLPTRDQRGVDRLGKLDAGAYEIGVRADLIIPIVKKIVLPSAPPRVTAKSIGRSSIRIDWALPTTPGTGRIMKYEIYRNGIKVATVNSNVRYFVDTKLDASQSYTYRIVSVGTQGNSIKSTSTSSIFPRK